MFGWQWKHYKWAEVVNIRDSVQRIHPAAKPRGITENLKEKVKFQRNQRKSIAQRALSPGVFSFFAM